MGLFLAAWKVLYFYTKPSFEPAQFQCLCDRDKDGTLLTPQPTSALIRHEATSSRNRRDGFGMVSARKVPADLPGGNFGIELSMSHRIENNCPLAAGPLTLRGPEIGVCWCLLKTVYQPTHWLGVSWHFPPLHLRFGPCGTHLFHMQAAENRVRVESRWSHVGSAERRDLHEGWHEGRFCPPGQHKAGMSVDIGGWK